MNADSLHSGLVLVEKKKTEISPVKLEGIVKTEK